MERFQRRPDTVSLIILLPAPPALENPSVTTKVVYYTDNLDLPCVCQSIPAPDVSWVGYDADVFKTIDESLPNIGDCNNILRKAQSIDWLVEPGDSRKSADGSDLRCYCRNKAEQIVEAVTHPNVQCKGPD